MRFGVTIPNNWGIGHPRQVLAMGPLAQALGPVLLPAPVRHVVRVVGRRLYPPARRGHRRREAPVDSKGELLASRTRDRTKSTAR